MCVRVSFILYVCIRLAIRLTSALATQLEVCRDSIMITSRMCWG